MPLRTPRVLIQHHKEWESVSQTSIAQKRHVDGLWVQW